MITPAMWLLLVNLVFLLVPSWPLGGVKLKWDLRAMPRKAGQTGNPPLPLPVRETFLIGEFPLGTGQCQLGGWDDVSK